MFAEKQKPISCCVNLVCLRGHRFPLCSFPFCVLLLVCIFTDWNYTLGCPNERTSDVSPSLLCYLSLGMSVASALLCACPLWATRLHNTTQCPNWSTCQDEKNRRRDKSGKRKRKGRRKGGKWKIKGVEDKTEERKSGRWDGAREGEDGRKHRKSDEKRHHWSFTDKLHRGQLTVEVIKSHWSEASVDQQSSCITKQREYSEESKNHNTSFNVVLLESFIAIDEMCEHDGKVFLASYSNILILDVNTKHIVLSTKIPLESF